MGNFFVQEKILLQYKVMRLVSQCLNLQTSIYLEFINIVEHLMSVFMDDFKTEWWVEFVDILHSLGKLILPYHEHFPKRAYHVLELSQTHRSGRTND